MSPLGEAMQSQVSPVSTTAGSSGDAADAAHKPSQRHWSICDHDCDEENEMYPLVVYSIQQLTCHIITYIILYNHMYIYIYIIISEHFLAPICPSWLAGRPKTAAECARNSQSDKSHQAPAMVEHQCCEKNTAGREMSWTGSRFYMFLRCSLGFLRLFGHCSVQFRRSFGVMQEHLSTSSKGRLLRVMPKKI